MTKEEKIKEAYCKLDMPFNENTLLNQNGWTKIKPLQYSSKYDDLDLLKLTNSVHSIRPKSLQGIETNNGWIKIESEDDLPKHKGDYFVYTRNKEIETVYADGDISLMEHTSKSWIRNFTHYQPIEKPKPPIY